MDYLKLFLLLDFKKRLYLVVLISIKKMEAVIEAVSLPSLFFEALM